jgi:hypothetical protein
MHPASRLGFVAGNKDDAVSPLGDLIERIVYAVGIGDAIACGDPVTLAGCPQLVKSNPIAESCKEPVSALAGVHVLDRSDYNPTGRPLSSTPAAFR